MEDRWKLPCCVDAAMSQLSYAQRDLFYRRCIAGETIAQIAERTDCSPEAVRRSLRLLRNGLQDLLVQMGLSATEAMDCLYQTLTQHY